MTASPGRNDRGFALLIVLWTLVLVALIVSHMVASARQETRLAGNLRTAAELGAAADGGVYEAIFHVLDKSAGHWVADGVPHRIESRQASLEIRVRSEAGKVNLNSAPPELLATLLREVGVDRAAADGIALGIVAWRARPGQAPSMAAAYAQAGRDYVPPNAPFESVRELGNVLGMTPAILGQVAPYLTVYHDGDVDPAAAAPLVLRALEDVYGEIPTSIRAAPDEGVIEVDVTARSGPARAGRTAIVRLGPTSGAKPYQIMTWSVGR
ncbi:MAG TPA: type II secretion system protein GspK [Acetobacteraceae bacterium]|nr:type II secretion system protein GspK [Acetobacteraceae bacterium]